MKGPVNSRVYKDIIDNCELPASWLQFLEGPFLFQYDFVPVHRASMKTWFEKFGVVYLKSPGLNLNNTFRDKLELRFKPSRPTSVPELINAHLAKWAQIPIDTVQNVTLKNGGCCSCKEITLY